MNRLVRLAVPVALAGLASTLVLPAASAATPPLKFGVFYADQPGADTPYTAARLNAEYIQVKNVSKVTQSLAGYTVSDNKKFHTYRFPSTFKLAAGKTVTIHTGPGTANAANLYWAQKSMVWNNTGDTARLSKGTSQITTCTYTPTAAQLKAKTGYKSC